MGMSGGQRPPSFGGYRAMLSGAPRSDWRTMMADLLSRRQTSPATPPSAGTPSAPSVPSYASPLAGTPSAAPQSAPQLPNNPPSAFPPPSNDYSGRFILGLPITPQDIARGTNVPASYLAQPSEAATPAPAPVTSPSVPQIPPATAPQAPPSPQSPYLSRGPGGPTNVPGVWSF